jgi:hypothetical protein
MLPLEYAIRNCDLTVIKLMFKLGADGDPNDILKMAVCRADLHVLASVIVNIIEN